MQEDKMLQEDKVLQATLLLSCYFNKNEVKTAKPLTPTEYARFAMWLHQNGFTPADLLDSHSAVLERWHDPKQKITQERIATLFSRGASMGFALEHWAKHGIWVVSRANALYPKALKEKLGDIRPPILFGTGNQALLSKPGIGFVGSRSIDADDEAFAKAKAELAVDQGYTVVSGGAKGIDQTAMLSALNYGGESVGIMADSLLRASTKKEYRQALKENPLALISPFYPEAGFSPGNAMARNKYIYTLSKSVVVVKSDFNKGGTWTGAIENLKKQWVPLLVRNNNHQGNQELIKLGAAAIDEAFNDFNQLPVQELSAVKQPETLPMDDLFAAPEAEIEPPLKQVVEQRAEQTVKPAVEQAVEPEAITSDITVEFNKAFSHYGSIFHLFYEGVVESYLEHNEITTALLLEKYPELKKTLISEWLKQLEAEGFLKRPNKKLIYKLTDKASA